MNNLPRLHTISDVFDKRETRNHPILAQASDSELNSYVIKHNTGRVPCNQLVNELLAYYFIQLWNIPTPNAALVTVKESHIEKYVGSFCQPRYFTIPCYATKYNRYAMEFIQFLEQVMQYEKPKFINKSDLLKIVLFDMWLANDDRTIGNPNILVAPVENGYEFWAIDHESIFNGGNLDLGLAELTYEDTLLQHGGMKNILGNMMRDHNLVTSLTEDAYICINRCEQHLDEILSYIPAEWQIEINQLSSNLRDNIFSQNWLDSLQLNFLSYLQQARN